MNKESPIDNESKLPHVFTAILHLLRMIRLLFRAELIGDLRDSYEISYLMSLLYVRLFNSALRANLAVNQALIERNYRKNGYADIFTIYRLMDSCLVIQTDMMRDETYGEERDKRIMIIADFVQAVDVYLQNRTHKEVYLPKRTEGQNER